MALNERSRGGEDEIQVVPREEIPRERWNGIYDLEVPNGQNTEDNPSLRQRLAAFLMASEQGFNQ